MASAPPIVGAGVAHQTTPPNRSILSRHLLQVVDRIPETRELGVVLIDFGQMQRLRAPPPGNSGVRAAHEASRRAPKATNAVLRQAGFSFARSTGGETISRPMRRALTTALDLQGGRRVPGFVINRVVRQRLMDGVGGVVGLFASSYSGTLGEAGSGFWDLVV